MTEDEAKTKWCPFGRALWTGSGPGELASFNRWDSSDTASPPPTPCLGSACMAWRKKPRTWFSHGDDWREDTLSDKYVEDGYCGLAAPP